MAARIVEESIVHALDETRAARGERGEARPCEDQAGGEPRRIDEGEKVARALQRRRVVVVEEQALVRLDAVEGIEDACHGSDRVGLAHEADLARGDDGGEMEADVADAGVVADVGARSGVGRTVSARRRRGETHVVDGETVLAIGKRGEPTPGVGGDALEKRALIRR